MASNPNVAFGFRPANLYGSSPTNYALNAAQIAWNEATLMAYGDPVYLTTGGTVAKMAISSSVIFGIFQGCEYVNTTAVGGVTFAPNWAAPTLVSTTVPVARLITDPTMVFMAQYIGTAVAQTDIGNNVDITTGTSGAPNGAGISTCSLGGTIDNTNTKPFRIVGIVGLGDIFAGGNLGPIPGYNPLNDNNFVYVKFNTSQLLNTTGVG